MDRVEVLIIIAVCLSLLNMANYVEGQNTVLIWRVVDEGNIKSFNFSPDNMQDFHDYVCDGNTLWCQLYYTASRGTFVFDRGNVTQSDTGNNMYSNMYSCRRTSGNAPFVTCERLTTTACSNVPICWSYQFSEFQGSCQLGIVGFTWASDQTFTQNVHNKVTVTPPCNRSCSTPSTTGPTTTSSPTTRSSTTTTVGPTTTNRPTSTTTVTTTTTPATVKPATTTTTSSFTTTSKTSGEGNALRKEDDSDNTGIIVGVVIAVLVVIAALIVGGTFWWRRMKNAENADRGSGNNIAAVHTSAYGMTSSNNSNGDNINSFTPTYENVLGTGRPSSDNVGSDNKSNDDNINSATPSYENVLGDGRQFSENVDSDNNNCGCTEGFIPTYENAL